MSILSRKVNITFIKTAVTLVICYFVYQQFEKNYASFNPLERDIQPLIFLASLATILITFILTAVAWRTILRSLGYEVKLPRAFKIMFLSNMGKYIPGKVWQALGMIYLAEKSGIPKSVSVASFVLSEILIIPSAMVITSLYLITDGELLGNLTKVYGWFILAGSLLILMAITFRPSYLQGPINYVLRKFKRTEIEFGFVRQRVIRIQIVYLMVWISMGVSFWFFALSLLRIPSHLIIPLITIYIAAYIVGYLSFLTPGGLGVREGALIFMLSPILPPGEAALLAVGSRFWFIIGEIICSVIAILIR